MAGHATEDALSAPRPGWQMRLARPSVMAIVAGHYCGNWRGPSGP